MISGISTSNYYTSQMSSTWSRMAQSGASGQTQQAGMGKGPSPGEMFDKVDLDGSGGLSVDEFQALADKISEATGEDVDAEELFAAYDVDGDGVLSEEETQTAMEENRPQGPPPGGPGGMMGGMQGAGGPDLSQMFSDADEDGDGSIDESEFDVLAEMISNATGEDVDAAELFATYDADEDGVLSEDETIAALEANRPDGPPPPPPGKTEEDSETSASAMASGIASYMNTMIWGMGQNENSDLLSMFNSSMNGFSFGGSSMNIMA